MSKRSPWKAASFGLLCAIGVAVGAPAGDAEAGPPKDAVMVIGMLEAAKGNLYRTPKDKEGHRQKAIDAVNAAIGELRVLAFGKDATKTPWPK